MNLTRRRLLAATAATGTAALAGCTGECGPRVPFVETGRPRDGEIGVERVASESVPDEATVVRFSELSAEERGLLATAVETGGVAVCLDDGRRAEALRSFADRLVIESYLRRDDAFYGLYVRLTDVVSTATAAPPETESDPCC
ncbi:hypothetical protein BRD18_01125 [Halobacteriales archaeon SW_7_71_33]|nr:MAG: hypothetical protein BRD18_01125 [Halobacteriales archaeon SW_7_71_33]